MKPVIGITLDYVQDDNINKYSDFPWYALRRQYSSIIEKNGGIPIFLPFEAYKADTESILNMIDALLIPGGDLDVPPSMYGEEIKYGTKPCYERCEFESNLILAALKKDMPILGICHGMQLVNVLRGGNLFQDIQSEIPSAINHKQQMVRSQTSHNIMITKNSLLDNILDTNNFAINSTPRPAINRLGDGLIISAKSTEDGVIEAIESIEHDFVLGIEWHPEIEASSPQDNKIFKSFVNAATEYKRKTS